MAPKAYNGLQQTQYIIRSYVESEYGQFISTADDELVYIGTGNPFTI